ncbi:MAG: ketoacyl-ACP synthase III [Oscillospiraceae bacterium]|nr:ketoacyl-ACP synthase III [Oscillospiraceae bacterium]
MNSLSIIIAGTGSYLPERVVTNAEFETFLDTSDEWIVARTGMKERRVTSGEPSWKMGELAARKALDAAGIAPEELDLIICTTVTPDYLFPSCACMIQGAIGARGAFAFDAAAACAGSVYGIDMARRYLATGDINTVLLVGAETLSQVANYEDRGSCILFSDGAGAAVIKRGDGPYGSCLRSDASGAHQLYCKHIRKDTPFYKSDAPFDGGLFEAELVGTTYMNGQEVYKFATAAMPEAVIGACERAGFAPETLDMVVPHQANLRILETAAKRLKLPMEKISVTIHKYGNNSSASVLIGLDECIREGKIKEGHRVSLVGFGAGLTYGAAAFEYHSK